jgi:hypothetical protein
MGAGICGIGHAGTLEYQRYAKDYTTGTLDSNLVGNGTLTEARGVGVDNTRTRHWERVTYSLSVTGRLVPHIGCRSLKLSVILKNDAAIGFIMLHGSLLVVIS